MNFKQKTTCMLIGSLFTLAALFIVGCGTDTDITGTAVISEIITLRVSEINRYKSRAEFDIIFSKAPVNLTIQMRWPSGNYYDHPIEWEQNSNIVQLSVLFGDTTRFYKILLQWADGRRFITIDELISD